MEGRSYGRGTFSISVPIRGFGVGEEEGRNADIAVGEDAATEEGRERDADC